MKYFKYIRKTGNFCFLSKSLIMILYQLYQLFMTTLYILARHTNAIDFNIAYYKNDG